MTVKQIQCLLTYLGYSPGAAAQLKTRKDDAA